LKETANPLNKVTLYVFTERQLTTKLNNGLKRYKIRRKGRQTRRTEIRRGGVVWWGWR
jgi:hypothetical protein